MAHTLIDNHDTNNTFISNILPSIWMAMTFTASDDYTITKVSLLLYRGETPPTNVVASIRATTAGVPSGADLCDGSVVGSTLTTNSAGTWIDFNLGDGTALTNGVKYSICLRPDTEHGIYWRIDTGAGYTNGNAYTGYDSGESWTTRAYDATFRTYSGVEDYFISGTAGGTSGSSADLSYGVWRRFLTEYMPIYEGNIKNFTVNDLTASRLVGSDANKKLESVILSDWVAGTADEIDITNDGDGTITIGIVDPLIVAKGGTGAASFTDHSILLGSSTYAFTALGLAANGQIPIGFQNSDPVLANITGTANQITVTNGAGTIALSTPQDIAQVSSPTFAGLGVGIASPETTAHIFKTLAANNAIDGILTIEANYGSATIEGFGGALVFRGTTNGGVTRNVARINSIVDAPTNNLQGLGFWITTNADTLTEVVRISSSQKVGIGIITPYTKLTVEGTITLKEQATADNDVESYGQIWVKTATPNELWFTDDAGTDVQLGIAASLVTAHESTYNHSNYNTAYSHSQLASGNPHSVTPTELSLLIGTNTQAFGEVLDDLNTLGVVASDGQFIVGTGAGAFAYESGDTARISLGVGTTDSPTFARETLTDTCLIAGGANFLRVTGLQTDSTAMTGTLRGAYIDVSNGSLAATGTIRGMELKARTEAPGDTGNNVAVLEGLSISADSKDHSVTTMRAAEFILDGSTGGTITEAVGLRIANNLQADKATNSYGLQIYRDSFDYTYDISLSLGGHITGDSYINQDLRTGANPTFAGVVIADGGTIGQAAGPILTFDDSGNVLYLSGGLFSIRPASGPGSLQIKRYDSANPHTISGGDVTRQTSLIYNAGSGTGQHIFQSLGVDKVRFDSNGTITALSGTSTQWNTAYTHSQLVAGNPHSVTPTELGLVIGTNTQAWDASLDSIAALTYASDSFIKLTAEDTYAVRTISETKSDLSLNLVENTALSTWAGTTNITTVGNLVIANNGTVGQAAGPLLTFDDSNNFLLLTGAALGIGGNPGTDLIHGVKSDAGVTTIMSVNNMDNTNIASHARYKIQSGGANGGDPIIQLAISGTQDWYIHTDNNDSDIFKIGTSIGTAKLSITTAGVTHIGDGTNYTQIAADGTVEFNGAATVWNDANVGAMMLTVPVASQPDEANFVDEATGDTGITAWAYAIGEKSSGAIEIPHDYKEGSDITFHIHWQGIAAPTVTDYVNWQLTYTVAQAGETLDAATVISTTDIAFDTQYEFLLSDFPVITGTDFNIGDQFLFTLERIAAVGDAYAGDTLVATIGFHYECDTCGSRQIITK